MSQKVHDVLILVIYMVVCSGFYYLGARAFIRVIGFLGRKTKDSFGLRVLSYFFVWLAMVAVTIAPFLVAVSFHRPADLVWTMLLVLLFAVSLLPAAHHIRKNMEVLYEAGYARRR